MKKFKNFISLVVRVIKAIKRKEIHVIEYGQYRKFDIKSKYGEKFHTALGTAIVIPDDCEHIYRRFIVKGNDKQLKSFENMIAKKQLSREDLKLILQTVELNPDICEWHLIEQI